LPERAAAGESRAYAAASAPATVVVQLPADAKLFVEGKAVVLDDQGSFTTPKLRSGEPYTYTVKAQAVRNGRLVNESKDIQVWAGETTRVAFRDLDRAAPTAARKPEEAAPARITVKLPEEAKLFVNGVACPARSFDTPKLDPERTYSYTLKADIAGRSESRVITFRAGQAVTADFGRADVRTASR
jgi:uncharacterized protein (TIGR03000 family)